MLIKDPYLHSVCKEPDNRSNPVPNYTPNNHLINQSIHSQPISQPIARNRALSGGEAE